MASFWGRFLAYYIASPAGTVPISASLSGTGTLTADIAIETSATPQLTGAGGLTANTQSDISATAALTGDGSLSADVNVTFETPLADALALSGSGALIADLGITTERDIAASLMGIGSLSFNIEVAPTERALGLIILSGDGSLAALMGVPVPSVAPALASTLMLTARDIQSGELWTWNNDGCSFSVEKLMEGDGPVTWSYPFSQNNDRLPPRFAHVDVRDGKGIFQTARIMRRTPPSTDACDGDCRIDADGYMVAAQDRRFEASVNFGPTWTGASLAQTAGDALTYSLLQLAQDITVDPTQISSAVSLTDSENFQGRSAQDVGMSMAALSSGFVTPIVFSVREGVARFWPLDVAPRYQVLVGEGAVVAPSDDASRLYNRVIVIWGHNQFATYPDTVSYQHIPRAVDLVVNATSEVFTAGSALDLAANIHARLDSLELGWSYTVTV